MKLYFQAGKDKRIAIDTKDKVFTTDYWFLGGYKHYIKVTAEEYKDLIKQCMEDHYQINWYAWKENKKWLD